MASLTGQLVAETYKALLKLIDNDILTASEKQITDGFGGGSNVFIDSQGFLRANKYKVTNGLATQFLKADGSLDSNAYLTSITGAQVITALGYTPVPTTRTITINGETHNLAADNSWTVAGTAAIWGNITGTLSNQTDLQNALNAKYNNPAGTISQYIRGDGSIANFPSIAGGLPTGGTTGQILAKIDATDYNAHWIDNYATQTKNEVKLGQTLTKGTPVYVSSANGTNIIVSAASNTSEALSSKTFGLLETGGATNDLVKCVTFGLLAGLDTSAASAGDPVWLGPNGTLIYGLVNKPYAPAHLVYIGVVTRVQSNNGEIFVNVQNGFELKEIHDVYIADPANNHGLFYDIADGLWKNKSIATALGYTPQAQLSGTGFVKASGTTITYDNSTYLTTADAASTYQLLTNLSTDLTASATKYPSVNAVIAGLATKQPLDADLTAIAGLAGTAGFLRKTAADTWALVNETYLQTSGGTLTGNLTISSANPKLLLTDTNNNPDYSIQNYDGTFKITDETNSADRFLIYSTGIGYYNGDFKANKLYVEGGLSTQFIKADGTLDSNTYLTAASLDGYLAKSGGTMTGDLNFYTLKTTRVGGNAYIRGSWQGTYWGIGAAATGHTIIIDQVDFSTGAYESITDVNLMLGTRTVVHSGNVATYALPITGGTVTGSITATSFVKSGGTSSQFLMADGSVTTLSSPVTGSGSAGYIPKWTTAANIGSSNIYDDGTSIGIAYSTPNKGGYGRTLTGAAFGSASFGFEAVGLSTTNGGLLGGFSIIIANNDSSRLVGSAIQSNLVGTTATNYGADLRFYAKADAGVLGEVVRMTSAGLRVYGTIIKDGGTSSQFLMADGSVSTGIANTITGSLNTGYIPKATGANTLANSLIYDNGSQIQIGTTSTNLIEFFPTANSPRLSIEGGTSSNTEGVGANIRLFDITNNRGWTTQMDAGYNYSLFYYNGSAWNRSVYFTGTGSATYSGTIEADTFTALNYVNAYNRIRLYFNSTGTIAAQLYENGASTNGGCLELYGKVSGTVDTVISAAPTQLNYINNAANVMIGWNTDQGYKLAVNGAGYFSGSLSTALDIIVAGAVYATKLTSATGIEYQVRNANGASGNHVFKSFNTAILTLDGGTNNSTFGGSVNVGINEALNNGAYNLSVLRGGTAASPGTYNTIPAILIQDYAGDGPATQDLAGGLFRINASRIADTDTYAANATLMSINNDNGSAIHINGKRFIGIGTTSPSQRLEVAGIVRAESINVHSSTDPASTSPYLFSPSLGALGFGANGSRRMTLDASGNLGIGTTSPSSKLHVSVGNVDGIRVQSSNSGYLETGKTGGARWRWANEYNAANILELLVNDLAGGTPGQNVLTVSGSGNVGIGTTTDAGYKLDVNGTGRFTDDVYFTKASPVLFYPRRIAMNANGDFGINNNANTSTLLLLNSSGNLGLGVTPSAWGSPFVVTEYPYGCYVGGTTTGGVVVGNNNYYNGANYIYKNTDYATQYQQAGGTHFWRVAPSGTAGTAITWTQPMTLDTSGRLGIGVSPSQRLQVNGRIRVSPDDNNGGDLAVNDGGLALSAIGSAPIQFWRNNYANMSMTITNAANVVVNGSIAGTSLNTSVTVNNPSAGNYTGFIPMTADTQRGYYGGTSTGLEIGASGGGIISMWTGGSERFQLSGAGLAKFTDNVGIRRSPTVALDVNGTTNGINLETSVTAVNAVTPYFTILETGVSRTMTGYTYDVTTPLVMAITQTAGTTMGLWRASNDATGSTLRGMKSRGTAAVPISPNNGDVLFSVEGWAIHGAGPNYPKFGGGMRFVKDDTFGTANTVAPARTEFVNAFNTTSSQITMTILPNGNVTAIGSMTATSFFESSDFRLKKLIEHNPIVEGIENLQAKLYEKAGKIEIGYFAQDAELIMPYAVTKNADGFLNLSYREVHTAKIARLEQRVAELEKQLNLN